MSKINYTDKAQLNNNPAIPANQKISYGDMNDIKEAVNQIGAFTTATAGTNGDFYCTLKGTLATGDIVNITFPSATNGASNARLSIDNGSNYKNIVRVNDNLVLKAYEVAGKRLVLFYNGTNFIIIAGANVKGKTIIVRKNTTQALSATTFSQLTYQTVDAGYDPNVFVLDNNDVLIKSSLVKTVGVTMGYQISSSHIIVTYMLNATSQKAAVSRAAADSGLMSGSFDATIGGRIRTGIYDVSGATTITSAGDWNYMIVTVLDTYE